VSASLRGNEYLCYGSQGSALGGVVRPYPTQIL